MVEKYKFHSEEHKYLLTPEDFELRVHAFIADPVATLKNIREQFINIADEDEYFDIAGETFVLIEDFVDFMYENELTSPDANLQTFFENGSYTVSGDTGLFLLLKAAGYTREEIAAWLHQGDAHKPTEDMFMTRQSLAVLDRIYG